MQDSNTPAKWPIPFANGAGAGFIRPIPQASQIGIQNGAASLTDGFPPNTFSPIAGGGSWPFGQDFNGLLNLVTKWEQWLQAGGPVTYDAAFQTAIGGYPKGSLVGSATTAGLRWLSTTENNVTNPDTGGAGWTADSLLSGIVFASSTTNFTATTIWHDIEIWGGGGGGGGAFNNGQASGGSGGGYSRGRFALVPGTLYPITIAAGGFGGAGTPTNGGLGGTSSFGSLISATGGGGGFGASGTGQSTTSAGGTGIGGQLNISGTSGGGSFSNGGGAGGAAFYSTGAPAGSNGATGAAGVLPGAGGGGTAAGSSVGFGGGAGSIGLCIVRWAA